MRSRPTRDLDSLGYGGTMLWHSGVGSLDRTAERMIADVLSASTPDAAMPGEELSPDAASAALDLADVAAGRLDGFWKP